MAVSTEYNGGFIKFQSPSTGQLGCDIELVWAEDYLQFVSVPFNGAIRVRRRIG